MDIHPTEHSHAVMLPCAPEDFAKFIGGLLGKPQTITQEVFGSFSLNIQDLVNIHHLIHQRITQQNNGNLIQITARIIYDDDSSVLLNSLADLTSYHEIRPVIASQIHLSWIYLLRFQDREFPEKQTIDLSFISEGLASFDDAVEFFGLPRRFRSRAAFRIQHTARTWGADIQTLLEKHLEVLITKESVLRRFIRRNDAKIQLIAFSTILLSSLFAVYASSKHISNTQAEALATILGSSETAANKIDHILRGIYDNPWNTFTQYSICYVAAALLFGIAFVFILDLTLQRQTPSFIRLTAASEKYEREALKAYKLKWVAYCCSFVVSIVSGLLSSYIYAKFWGV